MWGCLALAGPKALLSEIREVYDTFNKVFRIVVPDDYGEFPDTTGYTQKDFETMESDMEDPALYPFMQQAMDRCLDWADKKASLADKMGLVDIENVIQWPKFGGKIFAVAGIVKAWYPNEPSMIAIPGQRHVRMYGKFGRA